MLEEQDKVLSEEPKATISDAAKEKTLSYETHRKVLNEAKRAKQKARDLEQKVQDLESMVNKFEDSTLKTASDKDAAIETLRTKLATALKEKEDVVLRQSLTSKKSAIRQEAIMQGCMDPDALLRLIDREEVQSLDFDGTEVNSQDVRDLIQSAKSRYSNINLFKTESVKIHDAPLRSQPKTIDESAIANMSRDELKAAYENL